MFPFQRSCELSFKISDEGDQNEQNNSLEDQIILNNNAAFSVDFSPNNALTTTTTSNYLSRGRGCGRGRGRRSASSSSLAGTSNNNTNTNGEDERKILHREIERQRRLEMANLYNSLRSSLPDEYTQGKRSISDHVGGAINYITHLKKNVKELAEKRDQLKQSVESNIWIQEVGGSSNTAGLPAGSCSVVIRESAVGLQIELSIANEDEDRILLSTALQVVFEEGLEVVSSTSSRFNDRLIHILQCQLRNTTCFDVNRLQQRLNGLVC